MFSRTLSLKLSMSAALLVPCLLGGEPATAAERGPGAGAPYAAVHVAKDGTADASELDRLAGAIRAQAGGSPDQVTVLVHGFNVSEERGRKDYAEIAGRLQTQSQAAGLRMGVVGVHWASDAGPESKWFLAATGNRVASLLGMKHAVRNPYLETVGVARRLGQGGLRAVCFKLQDAFPGIRVNALTHSMGAEAVLAALAPQDVRCGGPIEAAGRALRLDTVGLAGADLDADTFCNRRNPRLALALNRADVWWVTVPQEGRADGVLELRRGAGRGDAVGNKGLELRWDDFNTLLARRGLVVDQDPIPAGHAFASYYNERRLTEMAASMRYLDDPNAPAARDSVLARLDAVLRPQGEACQMPAGSAVASVKLYSAWLSGSASDQFAGVRIADGRGKGRTRQPLPAGAIPVGSQAGR